MKKVISLLVIALILLCTACIYNNFKSDKIYYLALGDSLAAGRDSYGKYGNGYADYVHNYLKDNKKLDKYIKGFAKSGYEVDDLINDINNNKEITVDDKKITIQNALVKADLITLSIGSNDIIKAYKYEKNMDEAIETMLEKMDELFELLRIYSKEKIIVTSYYNPFYFNIIWNNKVIRGNTVLKDLAKKYDIIYVDIYALFRDSTYLPNSLDPHPSKEGYEKISELIIERIGDEK